MEVYLNICSEYSDIQVKNSAELVNESIGNHGLFQSEIPSVVDSHLKEINVLLHKGKTRNHGFQLLLPLIQQGSPELIEKRNDLWFSICCQSLSSVCGSNEKINACRIIILLLRAAPNLPEVQKFFLTKSHGSLIQSLATADSSWHCVALECLYELIKLIPGQCIPQKVVIEENMLKYLDNPLTRLGQEDAVKSAGQVFAALPLPGMGGNKAQGRAEARGRQVTQLLALAHKTMDSLFEGILEKEAYTHTRECTLKIQPIKFGGKSSTDTVRGFLAAVTRLGNILKFVSQMLTSESNESISVVPHHLLGPLFRLLQVDSTVLKVYRSQEHQLLSFLIVSLHHHCLMLLRDMIMSIGEGIDLYFGVISELLTSIIKMSYADDESSWCASGIQTRIIAYSVMCTVLQVSGGRHTPSKELINLVLKDVRPKSQQVTLQKTQHKGLQSLTVQKRKKKKGYSITQSDAGNHTGPFFQSEPLCHVTRSALALAETLFACASHSLPHKVKQILQMTILSISETVAGGAVLPEAYTCGKTRAQMYRTLASIATHPDPRSPPPYTMMLYLLQHGQQDQQVMVVTTCQALIGNISFILANPQISEMAMAQQHTHIPNGQDMEDVDDDLVQIYPSQGKQDIDDADEEEDAKDTEDEGMDAEKEENGVEAEPVEAMKGMENGDEAAEEEESDEEEEQTQNDSDTGEENQEEDRKINKDAAKGTAASKKEEKKSEITEISSSPAKRKTEEASITPKKCKRESKEKSCDGPSLDDMLECFVDADPDEQ